MEMIFSKKQIQMLIDSVYDEKCLVCKDILNTKKLIDKAENEDEKKYYEKVEKEEREHLHELNKLYIKLILKKV